MSDFVITDLGDTEATVTTTCDTTLADVVAETRHHINSNHRGERNRLDVSITSGATSLTLTRAAGGIVAGTVIAVDLELFYVTAVAGLTVTVEPAQEGSVAAAHTAGATIYVNPQVSDFVIVRSVNHVLRDLSASGLFRVATVDLANDLNVVGYNLTGVTSINDILGVTYDAPGSQKYWPELPTAFYRLGRNAVVGDFASGFTLQLLRGLPANSGDTIRVAYKASYNLVGALTDNIETVSGLHCEAHDILSLGAAVRLTESTEIARNSLSGQGDPRRAAEVPAGAKRASAIGLATRYKARVMKEEGRLADRYPTRYR